MTHPEELLAAYVDGSADPSERATVEAHLTECSVCSEELEHASAARAALASLPEVESPSVVAGVLAALEPERQVVELPAQRAGGRGEGWQRWGWAAGLAAAAAIAIVFLVTGGLLTGEDNGTGGRAADSATTATAPAEALAGIEQGGVRTRESLSMLAQDLLAEAEAGERSALLVSEEAAASPVSPPAGDVQSYSVEEIVACVQSGAGLGAEATPTHLEEATFEGNQVYVGAFLLSDGPDSSHLELVAVTRADCQPVYFSRHNT